LSNDCDESEQLEQRLRRRPQNPELKDLPGKAVKKSNIFQTLSQIFGFFLFVNPIRKRKVLYDVKHAKASHTAANGDA
jgi:hypothetical protein